ncbi:hypothetical protein J2Z40_003519 [Cytobacillus eiseniae]|uniref:Uncharacterized protein n=1 Tax=Cytobacillus eiseniae TaxID=762947 RepID=A0ABS4RJ68_9BACI|nr:hypothetical protein [Cytobacillus eiseniae]
MKFSLPKICLKGNRQVYTTVTRKRPMRQKFVIKIGNDPIELVYEMNASQRLLYKVYCIYNEIKERKKILFL